jgi:hypothetical protein
MTPRIAAAIALLLLSPVSARAIENVDWTVGPKTQEDKAGGG